MKYNNKKRGNLNYIIYNLNKKFTKNSSIFFLNKLFIKFPIYFSKIRKSSMTKKFKYLRFLHLK